MSSIISMKKDTVSVNVQPCFLSSHKTLLLILHTEPLIPFIYTAVSLCHCVTFRVSQLPAVIFSATYWDEVAVQQSGEHGCSVAQEAHAHRCTTALRWVSGIKSHSTRRALLPLSEGEEIGAVRGFWQEVGQVCKESRSAEAAVGVRQRDYHKDLFWLDSTALGPSDLWNLISLRPHLLRSLGNNIPQINKPAPHKPGAGRREPIRARRRHPCHKQEANLPLNSRSIIKERNVRTFRRPAGVEAFEVFFCVPDIFPFSFGYLLCKSEGTTCTFRTAGRYCNFLAAGLRQWVIFTQVYDSEWLLFVYKYHLWVTV